MLRVVAWGWLVGEAGQLCDDFCVAKIFLLDPLRYPKIELDIRTIYIYNIIHL